MEPPTRLQKYLSVETAGGSHWHPKRSQIAYVSNVTGTFQTYVLPKPVDKASFPFRLTYEKGRCTCPRYTDDGCIVFTSDSGGNENFQIGLVKDKEVSWLTSDSKAKHIPSFASKRWLYYNANILDASRLDIYRRRLPLLDNEPELVHEPEEGQVVVQLVSDNEKQAIMCKSVGSSQQELMLFENEGKHLTNITRPLTGTDLARWEAIRYIDSSHLLVVTDYGSDFNRLAILSLSGELLPIPQIEALYCEVLGTAWTGRSDLTYWANNREGYCELYQGRFESSGVDDLAPLEMPFEGTLVSGDVRSFDKSMCLSPDGRFLALTFSAPTRPTAIWIYDVQTMDMWEAFPVSTCGLKRTDFVDCSLLRINSYDGISVPYFRYLPSGMVPESGWPAMIMVHGGPEAQETPDFDPIVQFWLSAGFAVIAPNIRGSAGYGRHYLDLDNVEKRLDAIRDIREIAVYIREHDKDINGDCLVIFGGSYGGFAVLSAMSEYPDIWKAGIDIVGISNFVTFLQNTAPWRRNLREAEYGSLERDFETLIRISPINKVDAIRAPLFIVQGDNDERVPLSESLQIHDALQSRGVPVQLVRYKDEGHGLANLENRIDAYERILKWLSEIVVCT